MNSKEVVKFNFCNNSNSAEENVQVLIQQILDPSYGSYIWPSSYVLAQYIWRQRDKFTGKVIVELGSGTSLPSLLLTRLNSKLVVATDLMDPPHILENISSSFKLNHGGIIPDNVLIWGIDWKQFFCPSRENCGTMELMKKVKELNGDGVDYIIGADVLYNPEDFPPLIATVKYILSRSHPDARFITAYHERSTSRCLTPHLERFELEAIQGLHVSEILDSDEVDTVSGDELQEQGVRQFDESMLGDGLDSVYIFVIKDKR